MRPAVQPQRRAVILNYRNDASMSCVDGDWHLTLIEQDADSGHTFNLGRKMSHVEVDALQDASKVAATMLGSNLIGPFMKASNRLSTVVHYVLEDPAARATNVDTRLDWAMALDEWLVHLAMFRRRTEREVGRVLGSDAGAHAKQVFQDLYNSDEMFRLTWDWRNAAQHDLNPLELTHVSAKAGRANEKDVLWALAPNAAETLGPAWALSSREIVKEGRNCEEVIGGVVSACNRAGSQILIKNEDAIGAASDTLFDACKELVGTVTDTTKMPVSFAAVFVDPMHLTSADPRGDTHSFGLLPFRYDHAAGAMLAVNGARKHLGLPPKFDPSESPDDGDA